MGARLQKWGLATQKQSRQRGAPPVGPLTRQGSAGSTVSQSLSFSSIARRRQHDLSVPPSQRLCRKISAQHRWATRTSRAVPEQGQQLFPPACSGPPSPRRPRLPQQTKRARGSLQEKIPKLVLLHHKDITANRPELAGLWLC